MDVSYADIRNIKAEIRARSLMIPEALVSSIALGHFEQNCVLQIHSYFTLLPIPLVILLIVSVSVQSGESYAFWKSQIHCGNWSLHDCGEFGEGSEERIVGQRTISSHFLWSTEIRGKSEIIGELEAICMSSCQWGITKEKLVERSMGAGASWEPLPPCRGVHSTYNAGWVQHAYGRKPKLNSWQMRAFVISFPSILSASSHAIALPHFLANCICPIGFVLEFRDKWDNA